jgi:hypothetical protein
MRYAILFGALAVLVLAISGTLSGGRVAPALSTPPAAGPPPAPVRPVRPPAADDVTPAVPDEPALPVPTPAMRAAIEASARGAARPGLAAFRNFTDQYVDANLDFAERQAASEGITLAEVRELTHLGMLVLATQRVSDVEEMIGRDVPKVEQEALAGLMRTANDDFKAKLRDLVARRADEAERWALIRQTEARYLADFYATTGMTEDLLDDLLAGNMMLPGAPGSTAVRQGDETLDRGPVDQVEARRP